jgi:hypothetical protein
MIDIYSEILVTVNLEHFNHQLPVVVNLALTPALPVIPTVLVSLAPKTLIDNFPPHPVHV